MKLANQTRESLKAGDFSAILQHVYTTDLVGAEQYAQRLCKAIDQFEEIFGADREIALFSAPGRTEVGGNHTDHQRGRVLAASVNLDVIAVVSLNQNGVVRIKSEGYPMDVVDVQDMAIHEKEKNKAISLIRGVIARFKQMGYDVQGFDAYTTSNVLKGSGLSSSAAFEVLVGTIINHLFCEAKETAVKIAQIGQYAENYYFGKPCGLMDQTASSVGGFVTIDFQDPENPIVESVEFDFASCGYALCIVDTGGDHADLTDEYAAIPGEMKQVAEKLGKQVLREVDEDLFYSQISRLRSESIGDRAILRAIHFFGDNARVVQQVAALRDGDFTAFKRLIIESGHSSYMYLQNVFACFQPHVQDVSITLALCEKLLDGKGAYRVHGGGFAGTIQAFVPLDMLDGFKEGIQAVVGQGNCHVLSIRPVGGIQLG